ncbi:hypothetical protein ACFVUS_38165 [Nocardia sp. NPDC058058]|uniref:WXG100 family type VII secretion target n=1 Tax=Nocardia sp. NPDC058058 TaxID=3346317 RepID=UPI0036D82F83
MDPDKLRHNAQQAQRGAQREQGRISQGGVDPDYIQRLEHFPGVSHAEIYAHAQAMDPGSMQAQAAIWVDIADNLTGAITGLHSTVQSALADGIRGHIGDAAANGAREFVQWATDIAEIAHSTGHRMLAAAYGAEAVRRTVPPPSAADTDPLTPYLSAVIGTTPGAHARADARDELYQIALAAMEANYIPTYPPAGSGVPAFTTPDIGTGGNPPAGFESAPSGMNSSRGGTLPRTEPIGAIHRADPSRVDLPVHPEHAAHSGDPNRAAAQRNNGQPHRDDHLDAPSDEDTSPASATRATDIPDSDRTADPNTVPAGTPGSGNPLSPVAPNRSITTPGAPFEFPTTTREFPTPRRPTGLTPDPGHSYPGPPLPGTRSAPAPSAAPTGPTAAPMGLLPGTHPASGRAASDTDATRRTPDWLIRNRQQELLGTAPPTVPAVLGAEIIAARTDIEHPGTSPETI